MVGSWLTVSLNKPSYNTRVLYKIFFLVGVFQTFLQRILTFIHAERNTAAPMYALEP